MTLQVEAGGVSGYRYTERHLRPIDRPVCARHEIAVVRWGQERVTALLHLPDEVGSMAPVLLGIRHPGVRETLRRLLEKEAGYWWSRWTLYSFLCS
jgi:hypothetical protein